MFGVSRYRIGEAERIAAEAHEISSKALSEIAGHAATCIVRQTGIDKRLDKIEDQNKWQNRGVVAALFMILGAIILGIAEHKGLF